MKATSHILVWLGALLVLGIVVPAVLPPERAYERVQVEHDAALAIFGQQQTDSITERANSLHDVLIKQSGIQAAIDSRFTTEKQLERQEIAADTQRRVGTVFNRYLLTLSTQVYGLIFRGYIMLHWLLYVGIFLVAVVVDGFAQRKIIVDTAQSVSAVRYSLALHSLIAISFSPLVYLIAPFNVTPWFLPIWVIVVGYPLSKVSSNLVGFD